MMTPFLTSCRLMQQRSLLGWTQRPLLFLDSATRSRLLLDKLYILHLCFVFLFLLVLLLSQSMQKLMGLRHYLRDQSIFVEIHYEQNLSLKLEVVVGDLVNISHKVFILYK